jgi:hypothetical protein
MMMEAIWHNLDAIPAFSWRDWGQLQRTSVRMVCGSVGFRSDHLPSIHKSGELPVLLTCWVNRCVRSLDGNVPEQRPQWRLRLEWGNNIETNIRDMRCEDMGRKYRVSWLSWRRKLIFGGSENLGSFWTAEQLLDIQERPWTNSSWSYFRSLPSLTQSLRDVEWHDDYQECRIRKKVNRFNRSLF